MVAFAPTFWKGDGDLRIIFCQSVSTVLFGEKIFQFFFFKTLGDISPFCSAADKTDIIRNPVIGFKALVCMLSHLCAMNCSDSPLAQHLLTY